MTLLEAIAHMEGYYLMSSRPWRNANPGDLIYGPEAIRFGALRGDPRFAVFPDAQTGWHALQQWLSVPAKFDAAGNLVGGYLGATIRQVINRFAPPNENDTAGYIQFVCERAGLNPDAILTEEVLNPVFSA